MESGKMPNLISMTPTQKKKWSREEMTITNTLGYSWYQMDTCNIRSASCFLYRAAVPHTHASLVKLNPKKKFLWFKIEAANLRPLHSVPFHSSISLLIPLTISNIFKWCVHKITLFDFSMFSSHTVQITTNDVLYFNGMDSGWC